MVTARSFNRLLLVATILTITIGSICAAAQNPVGAWKLNEGSGSLAFDSSGGGHTAVLSSGVQWMKARGTWKIASDPSRRGYVTIPNLNLNGSRAVTASIWVKRSYDTGDTSVIFEGGKDYAQSNAGFALLADDETCHGLQAVLKGSDGVTANCYAPPSSNVWHHFTVVYDKTQTGGDSVALYLDGQLQTPTWNLSSATNTNNFGNVPVYLLSRGGTSQFSSGAVSNFQIYNGGLNEEQVQQIYNDQLQAAVASITYVQGNYSAPQSSQRAITVPFTAAQTAGNLNVVVVGWNDSTTTVTSIADSKGNTYTRAVGPTVQSGYGTQSIYYAKNIAAATAGSNTITVNFSAAAAYPDIRILEYSGADTTNPVDVTAASMGTGLTANSGSATTTNATDLIIGASLVQTLTGAPGTGFTKRILTSPDGDLVEDQYVSSVGSYSATASIMPSGRWIMQMVALRHRTPTLVSITVTPANPSISVGGHQQFTATGNYSDGSHRDLTNSATWSSSSPSVATINSTGYATGVAAGSTTIKAAVGSINGTTTLTVTGGGNFSIAANPSSLTIAQGNQNSSTITTTVSGGFNSAISLSVTGAPSGTSISFNPTSIPAPGSGSSVMTIVVGAGTAAGTYPLTVTGSGGGIQQHTTVTLTVAGAPTFSISANPSSVTVAQGHQGTSTVTTAALNGFNSSISLSTTGMPSGVSVSYSPNPIPAPGSGTSTMTITVGSSTAPGTYPLTVTGTGGGTAQSATVSLTVTSSSSTITYVQGNYATPQSPQTSVSVTYSNAQTAGDLNVVVVGWNDTTATVSSVQDSKGNVYTRAVGPTASGGLLTQSIYYAKNIASAAAGGNSVTVTFSAAAGNPDIRITEYHGADTSNPVDVTAAGAGNSNSSSSGSATTTNATDLIFGANIVYTLTSGPGAGFTNRMITSPDGDIVEDEMVTSTGSYAATAPLSNAGAWVMQMVAFRTPSGPPVLNSITVTPANPTIGLNAQQQFTATGNYSDGSHQNLTNSATWTSSSPSVATISSTGLASAVAAGSTTIKATSGSISGSTTLTVSATGTFTISANPSSVTVMQGRQGSSTITTTVANGFNNSIALSATGVPTGTTVSFNPTTIPAPGSGTSTMTITVGTSTSTGTYTITVVGTGGTVQQTASITLTVTAQVNLSWSASGSPNIAGYNVYRATTSGGPYTKINSSLDPNINYSDGSVQHGMYYYVTTAVNTQGMESGYSNEASANIQ